MGSLLLRAHGAVKNDSAKVPIGNFGKHMIQEAIDRLRIRWYTLMAQLVVASNAESLNIQLLPTIAETHAFFGTDSDELQQLGFYREEKGYLKGFKQPQWTNGSSIFEPQYR